MKNAGLEKFRRGKIGLSIVQAGEAWPETERM
jgi:hypothetical protein